MARNIIVNAKVEPELKQAVDAVAADYSMTTSSFIEQLLKENEDVKFMYDKYILKKKISQKK